MLRPGRLHQQPRAGCQERVSRDREAPINSVPPHATRIQRGYRQLHTLGTEGEGWGWGAGKAGLFHLTYSFKNENPTVFPPRTSNRAAEMEPSLGKGNLGREIKSEGAPAIQSNLFFGYRGYLARFGTPGATDAGGRTASSPPSVKHTRGSADTRWGSPHRGRVRLEVQVGTAWVERKQEETHEASRRGHQCSPSPRLPRAEQGETPRGANSTRLWELGAEARIFPVAFFLLLPKL